MTGSARRLLSGAVGAAALTAIHQAGRFLRPDIAPRMDIVGMRALERGYEKADVTPPGENALYYRTLIGDLFANASYYSAIPASSSRETWRRAVMFGVAAGLGAYFLPSRMNLGAPPNSEQMGNAVMTVAWYLTGALAAAACAESMRRPADAYYRARNDAYRRHQAERM